MRKKNGKQRIIKGSKLALWKMHLDYWGGTSIPTTSLDFPREACSVRADAKREPSNKDRFREIAEVLEISNFPGHFKGLQEIFSFCLLGEELISLGPGGPRTGEENGTYSTSLFSMTCEIHISGLDAVSL